MWNQSYRKSNWQGNVKENEFELNKICVKVYCWGTKLQEREKGRKKWRARKEYRVNFLLFFVYWAEKNVFLSLISMQFSSALAFLSSTHSSIGSVSLWFILLYTFFLISSNLYTNFIHKFWMRAKWMLLMLNKLFACVRPYQCTYVLWYGMVWCHVTSSH